MFASFRALSQAQKIFSSLRPVVTGLACGYCITRFFAEPIFLQGSSMEPTIHNNDVIIANKYRALFKKDQFQKGEIVVVRSPLNPNTFICKRIVGLPGDSVRAGFFKQTVPKGHVWLLGDNRNNSTDSREFGPLPIGLIIGVVIYRIWPFDRIAKFDVPNEHDFS